MALFFLDSSVIARAYLSDETGHEEARELVFGDQPVVASELAVVEVTRAVVAARRAGRLPDRVFRALLAGVEEDVARGGAVALIELDGPRTLAGARRLVVDHRLRTIDAMHLAVADREGRILAEPDELVFVSRDAHLCAAASALGLRVA